MHVTIYPKKAILGMFIIFTIVNAIFSYVVITDDILLSLRTFVIYLALTIVFVLAFGWLNRLELNEEFLIIRGDTNRGFKKYPIPLNILVKVETQDVPLRFIFKNKKYYLVFFNDIKDIKALKINEKLYFAKDLDFLFQKVKSKNIPYYKK